MRQEKSERALAAASLAVAQLHASVAVGQALSARAAEQQRAQQVADAAQPSLRAWERVEVKLGLCFTMYCTM